MNIKRQKYPWESGKLYELKKQISQSSNSDDYKIGAAEAVDKISELRILPSSKQIGENVSCYFISENISQRVIRVHFTESKVFYDLELNYINKWGTECNTRIYNVDSAYLESLNNEIYGNASLAHNPAHGNMRPSRF